MDREMNSKEYTDLFNSKLNEMKERYPDDIFIQRMDIGSEASRKGAKFVLEQLC